MNGKRFTWQAVALLPWIDANRLLEQTEMLEYTLTAEEKRRNSINEEEIYVNASHPLAKQFLELEEREDEDTEKTIKMDPKRSKGMNATLVSVKRGATGDGAFSALQLQGHRQQPGGRGVHASAHGSLHSSCADARHGFTDADRRRRRLTASRRSCST